MKALDYAVTVQYGGGMHYFLGYYNSPGEAYMAADQFTDRRPVGKNGKRRGAAPSVMVWQRMLAAQRG